MEIKIVAEKWELSAKNTGNDSKCWWEQKIDKIMWGAVKKCAEYRQKSSANGSVCKLNKSLLSISWLDLWSSHTTVERAGTGLTSSTEFAQEEKSVSCSCWFQVQTGEQRDLADCSSASWLDQENEWGGENPGHVPWRCNIAATYSAPVCTWRLSHAMGDGLPESTDQSRRE